MAKKASSRLPYAPLAESVFELRWKLQGGENTPLPMRTDPALLPLLHTFTSQISKLGFKSLIEMTRPEETGAYGVVRRFRKEPDLEFPLMQIGVGIFATNQGPSYEWRDFKKQILAGTQILLNSYPKLPGFALEPIHVELRYVDAFDETLFDTHDLIKFLDAGSNMSLKLPAFLNDGKQFEKEVRGRVLVQRLTRGWRDTAFAVDFGTAVQNNLKALRLETKVVTQKEGVPKLGTHRTFLSRLDTWLEFAHGLTSPFFKSFMTTDAIKRFNAPNPKAPKP